MQHPGRGGAAAASSWDSAAGAATMGSPCSTRLFISDSFYTFEKAKPITQLSFLHNRWPTATGTGRHDAASWPQKPQRPADRGRRPRPAEGGTVDGFPAVEEEADADAEATIAEAAKVRPAAFAAVAGAVLAERSMSFVQLQALLCRLHRTSKCCVGFMLPPSMRGPT